MTEQVLAENAQNQNLSTDNASVSASSSEPTEKMLRQSEVTAIAARSKQEGYDKARRELVEQNKQPAQQQYHDQSANQQQQSMGGIQQQSPADLEKLIEQKLQQRSQADAANQFVNNFIQKMEPGKTKYTDFEQKVAKLNLPNIPDIVSLAAQTDNTPDVMYDLANNPHNVVKLRQLYAINPQLAMEEMNNLSASIKQNEAAKNAKTPNEPLSQIKSTTTGTDNGSMSVRDYKKDSFFRA